jgi:DNA-binding transcriptional regulator YdaS (Cro superfamily)
MDGIQKLADFIARKTASQAQFARDVGCSEPHLSLILAGKRGLSVPLAKRISVATDGEVPVRALVPDKIEQATETLEAAQ